MRDNIQLWKKLGVNIDLHNAVLSFVGQSFTSVYLSQKNRPKGMDYFNTVMSDLHGARVHELMEGKEAGKVVVGTFCVFVPEEIVIAAGGVSIGLCAGAEMGFDLAEQYVPRNTCALIKSAFGFNLTKVCPFIEVADVIVGENTCDGKKKAYESYKTLVKDLYVMDLPQVKSAAGKALLQEEYARFAAKMESLTGNKITVASLKAATDIVNAKRAALARLATLRGAEVAPISGLDVLLVNQIAFLDDPERFTKAVNTLCDELEQRVIAGEGVADKNAARFLISGCPMALPNWKLPNIIEKAGAVIVGEETCTGERGSRNAVNTSAETVDLFMDAIVDRYMKIDCAIFTPNNDRLEHVKEMVAKYKADGVIHYSLQCCQPYSHEIISMEKQLENAGIATLALETDYSSEDVAQLQTRIEAFIERVK